MPRRPYKRIPIKPDPVYNSYEVAKLINYVMVDGKKSISQRAVYEALQRIKNEKKDPIEVLQNAINNVAPNYEVRPRRLGGASYLVPVEVRPERKLYLSLNWIIEAAKSRPNKEYHTFADKLYKELTEAAKNMGQAVVKKQQTEKLAEANKAFAHLKW